MPKTEALCVEYNSSISEGGWLITPDSCNLLASHEFDAYLCFGIKGSSHRQISQSMYGRLLVWR